MVAHSGRLRARRKAADWRDISGVSLGQSFDPRLHPRSRLNVAQGIEPAREQTGPPNFDHDQM
jgi:hypothetical protein